MKPAREHGSAAFAAILQRAAERKAWEAEHPEIAKAWDDASKEDLERAESQNAKKEAEERARHARAAAPRRLERLGCPPRAVALWDGGEGKPTTASRALERMATEGKCLALLTGDTGVGKTCAAVAFLAGEVLKDRRDDLPVLFVRATECARMGLYDEGDKKLAHQMRTATALVIDDLGAEFMSEGSIWRTVLDEVIDTRYGESLATVLTTNLTAEAFKVRYGERIADRIRHAGIVENCGTGSLRERGQG